MCFSFLSFFSNFKHGQEKFETLILKQKQMRLFFFYLLNFYCIVFDVMFL